MTEKEEKGDISMDNVVDENINNLPSKAQEPNNNYNNKNDNRLAIMDFCIAKGKKELVDPISGENLGGEIPDYHFSPSLAADTILKNYHLAISEEEKNNPKATIYMWDGQRWRADAESIIKNKIYDIVGDLAYAKALAEMRNRIVSKSPVLKFDADINIINLKNGRYNWRTGEFIAHNPNDPYPSLIQHPIEYDTDATCPNIDKIIEKLTPDKLYQQTLKEWAAYCFYRYYLIKKSLIMYGPGGTGKSIYGELLDNSIGIENSNAISLHDITHSNFAGIGLKGKCRNNCGETPATEISASNKFKALTGRDAIRSDVKYKDAVVFYSFAKIEMMLNEVFKTKDKTDAFYKRLLIVLFLHQFTNEEKKQDAELLKAIRDPKELSGFFNEVMELLPGLIDRQAFSYDPSAYEIERQFNRLSEPIEEFIKLFVIENPEEKTGKQYLYDMFKLFSSMNHTKPCDKKDFDKYIKNLDYVRIANNKPCSKRYGDKTQMAWPNISFDDKAFIEYTNGFKP